MSNSSSKIKKSKWLDQVEPQLKLSEVARVALQERLDLVSYYVPLVAHHSAENVEYVHQLRVAVRRCQAAIELFAPLLPLSRSTKLYKFLNKLRKLAGDARDLDVFIAKLHELKDSNSSGGYKQALKELRLRRSAQDGQLLSIEELVNEKQFKKKSANVISKIRWREAGKEPTLKESAPSLLSAVVSDFFSLAEEVIENPESLHALRIESKRLRYAMELIVQAFPAAFKEELYPKFETVQKKLGEVNDHASAAYKLSTWAKLSSDEKTIRCFNGLVIQHEKQYRKTSDQFIQWWNEATVADFAKQFTRYLLI